MPSDRYLKTVLTVIAGALCILTLTQLELPSAGADEPPARTGSEAAMPEMPSTGGALAAAGAGTLPVRWLFPYFAAVDDDSGRDCQTHVTILNLASKSVAFEVDFLLANTGTSAELVSGTVQSGRTARVLSGPSDHGFPPYVFTANTGTLSYNEGYVKVHADDPRIVVQGTLLCTPGGSDDLEIVQTLSGMPVGATLTFFQAGMPGTGSGPLAEPES